MNTLNVKGNAANCPAGEVFDFPLVSFLKILIPKEAIVRKKNAPVLCLHGKRREI